MTLYYRRVIKFNKIKIDYENFYKNISPNDY